MLEYLYASVANESSVGLPNEASFVKFKSSGTLISNLKKSPLVFHAISRSAVAESPCLQADPPMAGKPPGFIRLRWNMSSEKDRDRKGP